MHVVPVVPVDSLAVVADQPMVDANAQDIGAHTGAEAAIDEAEGFSGGLKDPSVLTEYVEHVAANIWSEEVCIIFNLSYLLSILFLLSFWLL